MDLRISPGFPSSLQTLHVPSHPIIITTLFLDPQQTENVNIPGISSTKKKNLRNGKENLNFSQFQINQRLFLLSKRT
jgi:hypothetical protein